MNLVSMLRLAPLIFQNIIFKMDIPQRNDADDALVINNR